VIVTCSQFPLCDRVVGPLRGASVLWQQLVLRNQLLEHCGVRDKHDFSFDRISEERFQQSEHCLVDEVRSQDVHLVETAAKASPKVHREVLREVVVVVLVLLASSVIDEHQWGHLVLATSGLSSQSATLNNLYRPFNGLLEFEIVWVVEARTADHNGSVAQIFPCQHHRLLHKVVFNLSRTNTVDIVFISPLDVLLEVFQRSLGVEFVGHEEAKSVFVVEKLFFLVTSQLFRRFTLLVEVVGSGVLKRLEVFSLLLVERQERTVLFGSQLVHDIQRLLDHLLFNI